MPTRTRDRVTVRAGGYTASLRINAAAGTAGLYFDETLVMGGSSSGNTVTPPLNVGSPAVGANLLQLPAPVNSSIFATHTTQTMTHSIRIIANSVPYFIMCTNAATNRGGGS